MNEWWLQWAGLQMTGVAGLWAKFDCMIALRTSTLTETPRAQLRALAQRFPGALRELDQRALADLQSRRATLATAMAADGKVPPPWVAAQLGYHGFVHVALRLRSALRSAEGTDEALRTILAGYRPELDEPQQLNVDWLTRMSRPRGGRISPVAFAFVAERLRTTASDIERLVFE